MEKFIYFSLKLCSFIATITIVFVCLPIAVLVFKDIGWDVPFRWICITGLVTSMLVILWDLIEQKKRRIGL